MLRILLIVFVLASMIWSAGCATTSNAPAASTATVVMPQAAEKKLPLEPGVKFSGENVISTACAPRSDSAFTDDFFLARDRATLKAMGNVIDTVCMTTHQARMFMFLATDVKYNDEAVCVENTVPLVNIHCGSQ